MNREKLAVTKKVLWLEHPCTLTSMTLLPLAPHYRGKYEEAEAMNREALGLRKKVLGPEHPDTLASIDNLESVLKR